jgi:hypothetical protein
VCGGIVFVQVSEDWRESLSRVQIHCWFWIFGVHVHDEVGVRGKERHLTYRIPTIGAVCVSLDEFPDSEAIRSFTGRDGNVFAHELVSFESR